jgi:hypothetical protein
MLGWPALREWMDRQENEQAVFTIANDNRLSACNRAQPSACIKTASDTGGWHIEEGAPSPSAVSLVAYFDAIPSAEPLDFELFASLPKEEAVACGRDIASKMAQLFTDLLPLYQVATSH